MINNLRYKELDSIDIDSDELIAFHRNILLNKKIIGNVFKEFYNTCDALSKKYSIIDSDISQAIEIGSGSSLFKHYYSNIISTDIKKSKYNDMELDAQNMLNISNDSIDAFFAINCFHHFPNPELFFNELNRTLKDGGTCVIIEPYFGLLGSFLYKRMFATESFDKTQKDWNYISDGPMTGANQALSYIVFFRDLKQFLEKNPTLEIVHKSIFNNYMRYLFSGGLNFKQLVPTWMEKPLKIIEWILTPINQLFALHHVVVIRKKAVINNILLNIYKRYFNNITNIEDYLKVIEEEVTARFSKHQIEFFEECYKEELDLIAMEYILRKSDKNNIFSFVFLRLSSIAESSIENQEKYVNKSSANIMKIFSFLTVALFRTILYEIKGFTLKGKVEEYLHV